MERKKVIIMGAAGRDFHNFNVYFRNNPSYEVVGFTATQIPNIEGRVYPPLLSGPQYPKGISIYPESELSKLIKEKAIEEVVFAYSDVPHLDVMHKASLVLSCGADFKLMGPDHTMLKAEVPVVSIGAVRTGAGKSQTTRKIAKVLKKLGVKVVVIRHPMPYGDLTKQICQRFEKEEDLTYHKCTIEEREEYLPHLEQGSIVYAGVDYGEILKQAQKEAEVIIWDGGNNDFPFYRSDLHFVVVDPHRPGHEELYHPGETNLRMADCVIINKVDSAAKENVEKVKSRVKALNPKAVIIEAASPITADKPELLKGKKVLAIEDGPTVTHGDMGYGAAYLLSKQLGGTVIDPRPFAVGSIKATFEKYPHLKDVLPAMGYSDTQMEELRQTIENSTCDVVAVGTPADIRKFMKLSKPAVRISYELDEKVGPSVEKILKDFLKKHSMVKT
ncbi:MAG: cyclic 2,3-diphosphoglycerate synthase [Firmicutes bacterium]|nr:cyclic 2,3-diphosphoglycerate synthase [Bacillota bacterium]